MTQEQFHRVEELFEKACELPSGEREAFIRGECPDDPTVLRKALGMLARDSDGAVLLEPPTLEAGIHGAPLHEIERRLKAEFAAAGQYHLIEPIGEGGFGTVYKAEQLKPVRRVVALKIIKPGMDTRRVIARFEAERQSLAVMEHPAIARVYDAGATPSGRPYFAMEYVSGIPITRYCDQIRMPARQRIELFIQVAGAVQHAHQKGIIHRDIKPSNVLVLEIDRQPLPKLIDFGIARAMDQSLGAHTQVTEQGQMIGTPEYMSPEQASGVDIDTRTDIYSLGVLLYELLIGTTPIDRASLRAAGYFQIQQLICEQPSATPSERLKSLGEPALDVAGQRQMELAALHRILKGDLDWIVMKAIEKDRSRRYETTDAFISDLRRYLNNESVLARPPTTAYRFRKFARRNRGPLAAGIVIFVLLIAGVIGTALGMLRAQREARSARTESDIARAVSDFLNQDLLSAVAPDQLGNDASMRKVIEVASQRVDGKFRDQPLVEAAVRLSLGRTFSKLSDLPAAQRHLEKSLELRRAALSDRSPESLEVGHELALVFKLQDRNADAEKLLRKVYEGRVELFGEQNADTISSLYELSVAIGEQGRYAETESMMVRALELSRRHLGNKHPLTLTIIRGVGVLYHAQGQLDRAATFFEEAYRLSREGLSLENPVTLLALQDLASIWIENNRAAESESLLNEGLAASKRMRGADHPATLVIMSNLASARGILGRNQEAELIFQNALQTAAATLPPGHTVISLIQLQLAKFYDKSTRWNEAEALFLQAFEGRRSTLGPDHPLTLEAIAGIAAHYERAGDSHKAAQWRLKLPSSQKKQSEND